MPMPSFDWVYADVASDCSPAQPGSKATASHNFDAETIDAPEPCSGNSAASPFSSWMRWPPKHHTTSVAPLSLFELATCFGTQVKEGTEVSVHPGPLKFLFGLSLGVPVICYCGLVPCAVAIVGLAKLFPLRVDGCLSLRH